MLKSNKSGLLLEIKLANSTRSHAGWIPYFIAFSREDNENNFIVHHGDELFFENYIDPEIDKLIEGISDVLDGKDIFSFEPVDERDFTLTLKRENGKFTCYFQVPGQPIPKELDWSRGVEVNACEVRDFCSGLISLKSDYEQVAKE